MRVYTLGYGGKTIGEFIKILKENKIEVVIDVRRFPTSKIEEFKRENLERYLKENGIEYIWMGEELGGFRGGYLKYMETEDFKKGFERLKEICKKKVCCIICKEKIVWRCHRRFIAKKLKEEGFEVINLL